MIEVLIAIIILTVGIVSLAALLSRMDTNTNQSRYAGTAALLASEKLEHLNRLPADDSALLPGGGLGNDVASYNDQVAISVGNGTYQETFTGAPDPVSGATTETYTQGPDGVLGISTTAPATDAPVFKRRWLVESGPAGLPTGTKRITVFVTAPKLGPGAAATFQMSMVRYGG